MSWIFSFLLSSAVAVAQPFCSESPATNKEFTALKSYKNEKLKEFANSKVIAKMADELLATLIKSKNAVLLSWFDRRNLINSSEAEIISQWRVYFAENLVIGRYDKQKPEVQNQINDLIKDIYFKFFSKSEKARFQQAFDEAKELSAIRIRKMKIESSDKKLILEKINSINLNWFEELPNSDFAKQPLEIFSWGVAYSPSSNKINLGLNALEYSNLPTLFAVFAHEIGHSFDPCRWGAFFTGENPFQKVISCLRSKESVGAKVRDDSQLETFYKAGKITAELKLALALNPTCNRTIYPPPQIQADQMAESFADWFSSEVISLSQHAVAGLRSDLCVDRQLNPGSSYPSNTDRLNRIYLSNKVLKEKLAKESKLTAVYCQL